MDPVWPFATLISSGRRKAVNLFGIGGIAVVLANFDSPLPLAQFGEKSLFPGISVVAHSEARGNGAAGLIQLPHGLIDGLVASRIAPPAHEDDFSSRGIAR